MMATGWTVVEGSDPVSFDVEILGVLPDGIAPGVDFILVHTSGPVIDETGGIAAGFSGSPVYIGGDLVGAIAYGFSAADQTFGGSRRPRTWSGCSSTRRAPGRSGRWVRPSTHVRARSARPVAAPANRGQRRRHRRRDDPDGRGATSDPGHRFRIEHPRLPALRETLRLGGLSLIPYRSGAASLGALAADPRPR